MARKDTELAGRDPTRAVLTRVALVALGVKLYSLLLLFLLSRQVSPRPGYDALLFLREGQSREDRLDEARGCFLERLAPYDGQFYLDISERGYRSFGTDDPGGPAGPPGNYAFFPLYPALLGVARRALGDRAGLACLLGANVAFSAVAAALLFRLAARVGTPPWPSVLLLLAFPTAVFQSFLYPESLFLFLSVSAAVLAHAKRGGGAALPGYLAGLCRPQGALVSSLFLGRLEGGSGGADSRGRARIGALATVVAPLAGVATFAVVLWAAIGSPLGFLGIQGNWGRGVSPARLLGEVARPWAYGGPPLDLLGLVLGVGLVPCLWKRLPWPIALYGTASVLVPLSTGTILSLGRFLSVSFPHFLCLASLLEGRRALMVAVLAASTVLQCLVAKGAMGWCFVG